MMMSTRIHTKKIRNSFLYKKSIGRCVSK
jgi:hypothetical protein